MRMTVDEAKKRFPNHPGPVPLEYDGQWIAWDRERTQIIAHGHEFTKVRVEAKVITAREPILQRVICRPLIGGARQPTIIQTAQENSESQV